MGDQQFAAAVEQAGGVRRKGCCHPLLFVGTLCAIRPKSAEPALHAESQEPFHQPRKARLRPISRRSRYDHVVEQTDIDNRIPEEKGEKRKIQEVNLASRAYRVSEKAPYQCTADK